MQRKIKVYGIIILSLLILEFVINSIDEGIPKKEMNFSNYHTIDTLKQALKNNKTIEKDIIRLSHQRGNSIDKITNTLIERLFFFDQKIANTLMRTFNQKHLNKDVVVRSNTVDVDKYRTILENFQDMSDAEIMQKQTLNKIHKFKVQFIKNKKRQYIYDVASGHPKKLYFCHDAFVGIPKRVRGTLTEDNVVIPGSMVEIANVLLRSSSSPNNHMGVNESTLRVSSHPNDEVGVITERGFSLISTLQPSGRAISPLDFFVKKHVNANSQLGNIVCYTANSIINNYIFNLEEEDLMDIGDIYHAGPLLEYNLMAGVVDHTLDDPEIVEAIIKCCPPSIINNTNRNKFIIHTNMGAYLVTREDCDNVDVIRKTLATERSVLSQSISKPEMRLIPSRRSYVEFQETLLRYYDFHIPEQKSNILINYNQLMALQLNVETQKDDLSSYPYPNTTALEAILGKYDF